MDPPQFTIESDDEVSPEEVSEEEEEESLTLEYDDGRYSSKQQQRREREKSMKTTKSAVSNGEMDAVTDHIRDMPHAEERAIRAKEKAKGKRDVVEEPVGMDAETEASYFDSIVEEADTSAGGSMFSELNLSRSLLRAVEACGYVNPTPVQAKVIPFALAGRDICASALTGSGKTAAFALPFLERLLFRPRDATAIRVLVVTPTRELATQIYSVLLKLAQFTDVTCALICGGKKDLRSQETTLRNRPDVVVCTPGRIIDHLRNSRSVTLDDLDVLVLDEVDRLLDLGFQEEVEEIVKYCPHSRQTMLFSATMTSGVDDLARLSLKRPVRIKTQGDATTVAPRLVQEFVRVRRDEDKEAMLAALVCRTFNQRAIVFFETKRDAHRFFVLLTLLDSGVAACELHGDMTQPQREQALLRFTRGECQVLIATDVVARGLDISAVQTVLNAEMPRSTSTYVHRVGRTARAGRNGRSVTLVSDGRRKVMKDLLKSDASGAAQSKQGGINVLSRTIPAAVISHYIAKIASLEDAITQYYREEKMKAKTDTALREAERAENLLMHEDEIHSRPARTWYQTETQKQAVKEASRMRAKEESLAARGEATMTEEERIREMALRDEYRDDEETKSKSKEHRLSRKKRRRIEALKEIEEESVQNKAAVKRAKVSRRENAEQLKEKTPSDISKKAKADKVRRPVFAVGGLDHDMNDWNGSTGGIKVKKKVLQKQAKESEFSEFDPNKKLRKGGKLGHKSFKSKSKYKRRK
mmetsp:Transcript_20918/g.30124  ORF Transcript_20918/g.30124 Transcript_20918/m.30124 type:complete len:756 (+) Transcript_20918:54-2321(+)